MTDYKAVSVMSSTIQIVTFKNKYSGYFKEFNLVWLQQYFSVEDIDRKVLENPEEQVIATGGMIFFALHDAEPVGTTAVLKHDHGVYELSKLAVRDDMQRKGIGKLLIASALEWIKSQNGSYVFLESNSILEPAIKLYEYMGFEHEKLDGTVSHYSRTNLRMGMILKPKKYMTP